MMKCSDVRKEISRELDGVLDEERLSFLAGHLESCDACREFRAALARVHSLHRAEEELDPPMSLLPSIMDAVEERGAGPTWARGWLRFALPAAAAVVLFLGILAGGSLTEMLLTSNGTDVAEVFGLEYLEEHPPGSVGELMLAGVEGGVEDER
jgi:predicted anti-sigma-YlaC factor YlaD